MSAQQQQVLCGHCQQLGHSRAVCQQHIAALAAAGVPNSSPGRKCPSCLGDPRRANNAGRAPAAPAAPQQQQQQQQHAALRPVQVPQMPAAAPRRAGDTRTLVSVTPIRRGAADSNTAFGRIELDQTFPGMTGLTAAYRNITLVDVHVELLWLLPPAQTGILGYVSAGFAHTDVPAPTERTSALVRPQAIMVSFGSARQGMTLVPFPDLSRHVVASRRRAGQVGLSIFWAHTIAANAIPIGLAVLRTSAVVLCRGHATV